MNNPSHSKQALRYLPHMEYDGVLSMGLSRIESRHWIETDDEVGEWHRFKVNLAAQYRGDVYRVIEEGREAASELASLIESYLLNEKTANYQPDANGVRCIPGAFSVARDTRDPLWGASLLIADDLVVMVPQGQHYVLGAASLCSPSHWRLEEKLGLPMRAVHDPVPEIHDQLSSRIERFFDGLHADALVQRFNWSLQFGDTRFAPTSHADSDTEQLYYRVERQTLRRLPQTGAIAFTIRVYLSPIDALSTVDGALPTLLDAVRAAPPALAQYKDFPRYLPALESVLAAL